MKFKEWLKLQEAGTGTSSVAMFVRPVFGEPFRRPAPFTEEDPFFKKKRRKDEHGMDPTAYGSTLGSDPDGQSLPSSPLKAVSSTAQTLPQGDQPTLMMPIKNMKKGKRSR